ncbi:hypothetical protein DFH07DRAFT_777574 [Mycena maculata]|uniref:Uncharacterized protein n=1 Tax=Mycena maculata TaxID=230809 RepID=A0AAD7N3J9_9AGAR|nr:hypothetical protein DFH07DRAFT_777574 [Mycena maculata]
MPNLHILNIYVEGSAVAYHTKPDVSHITRRIGIMVPEEAIITMDQVIRPGHLRDLPGLKGCNLVQVFFIEALEITMGAYVLTPPYVVKHLLYRNLCRGLRSTVSPLLTWTKRICSNCKDHRLFLGTLPKYSLTMILRVFRNIDHHLEPLPQLLPTCHFSYLRMMKVNLLVLRCFDYPHDGHAIHIQGGLLGCIGLTAAREKTPKIEVRWTYPEHMVLLATVGFAAEQAPPETCLKGYGKNITLHSPNWSDFGWDSAHFDEHYNRQIMVSHTITQECLKCAAPVKVFCEDNIYQIKNWVDDNGHIGVELAPYTSCILALDHETYSIDLKVQFGVGTTVAI